MRILIITHAPLSAKMGAGQMAVNLAEALRERGHDTTVWSPHPLPPQKRRWQRILWMRSKLNAFIETQPLFDVIDIPAVLITRKVSQSALVVARSVQPDILYLAHSLNPGIERNLKAISRIPFEGFYTLFHTILVLQGWRRAKYILCLGSLELQWMKKWFPWWKSKLNTYVNALSPTDRKNLSEIRKNRRKPSGKSTRFIWIGRWASHKGITKLLTFIVKRAASHPQDTFTVAGCGTDTEKDFPSELIQSGRLKIIASFDRNQLYSLLASHDVGLFTSRVEGWGLVLNEMLESGMAVFATSAGGVIDLQPFFKTTLKTFPPPLELVSATLNSTNNMDTYYALFNWSTTAKFYEALEL
jgi:glycosyltransferase involved in cell wall biosynthesis